MSQVSKCWKLDNGVWSSFPQGLLQVCFPAPNEEIVYNARPKGKEKTFVEWEIQDINGDGYPDFVFNTSPVRNVERKPAPQPGFGYQYVLATDMLQLADGAETSVNAVLNVVGVRFDTVDHAFSAPITLIDSTECGVARWAVESDPDFSEYPLTLGPDVQWQSCGIGDVNGDGLADRIGTTHAVLGTGVSFSDVGINLPGPLRQLNPHDTACDAQPTANYRPLQISALRDLTGDGIPDFVQLSASGGMTVAIGTGTSFNDPIEVQGPTGADLQISETNENCQIEGRSDTTAGLYDLDGDGKPEFVRLLHSPARLVVYQLDPEDGVSQAGNLSLIDNGYGAITTITYGSKKDVQSSGPFPEIVVTSVETSDARGQGGKRAAVHYAYGDGKLFFDPVADTFTLRGYGTVVELHGAGDEEFESDFAIVRVAHSSPPEFNGETGVDRYHQFQKVGRVRDIYRVRGPLPSDAWELLRTFNPWTDTRRMAGEHHEWRSHFLAVQTSLADVDCTDVLDPYDPSLTAQWDTQYSPCTARGFTYANVNETWWGGDAPPHGNNVQTRSEVLLVDNLGRILEIKNENDRFRTDDDVCVYLTYAEPTTDVRVFSAVASRQTTTCAPVEGDEFTLAAESWEYDTLPGGFVSLGLPTSHTVERHATDDGEHLGTVREYELDYDDVGNLEFAATARDGGVVRTVAMTYDEFGLTPTTTRVSGTGLDAIETSIERDQITLEALSHRDANGTVWGRELDRFGRETRSSVTPPGGSLGVVSTTSYLGFEIDSGTGETHPDGRTIVAIAFRDPVDTSSVNSTAGRESTVHLDELGRSRRMEWSLGADYSESVVTERTYDGMGRVSFESDPRPATQDGTSAYGTTFHYSVDGDIKCAIRGHGPQALTDITDAATERFPTCMTRWVDSHVLHLSVQTPDSLLANSPQAGIVRTDRVTAIGRLLSRETAQLPLMFGARLEYAEYEHDRLGQLTTLRRFLDPGVGSEFVDWTWRHDSQGLTLSATEPETDTRRFTYSAWSELLAVEWEDSTSWPPTPMSIEREYDAFGRIIGSVEKQDGVEIPETSYSWTYDSSQAGGLLNTTHVAGRLTKTSSSIGDVHLSYDAFGRVTARAFVDPNNEHYLERTEHHFDGALSLLEFSLSDTSYVPERYHYAYDSASRLLSVTFADGSQTKTLYEAREIDPLGWVRKAVHGDGLTYEASRAPLGRRLPIEEKFTGPSGQNQRFIHLEYDPLGREIERREHHDDDWLTTINEYDALGRLATSIGVGSNGEFDTSFAYDPLGNVLQLTNALTSSQVDLAYNTSGDRDRLCRVRYLPGTTGPCNVEHDGSGNVTQYIARNGKRRTLTYFPSGAVRQINQDSTQATFRYDGSGSISELDVEGLFATDPRRDRQYGLIQRRDVGGQSLLIRHIPGIASRRGGNGPWIFPLSEKRGTRFASDNDGNTVQELAYLPFGQATSTGTQTGTAEHTTRQWNGGDALADFGVVQLGVRIYDPIIGRFLSRDPLVLSSDSNKANPYAFSYNDPINFSDPTGQCPEGCPPPLQPFVPNIKDIIAGVGKLFADESSSHAQLFRRADLNVLGSGLASVYTIGPLFGEDPLGATATGLSQLDSEVQQALDLLEILNPSIRTDPFVSALSGVVGGSLRHPLKSGRTQRERFRAGERCDRTIS